MTDLERVLNFAAHHPWLVTLWIMIIFGCLAAAFSGRRR